MSSITTKLIEHECIQTICCCCCGARWEEVGVGVTLTNESKSVQIGHLCPRCISHSPQHAAAKLQQFSQTLEGQLQLLHQCLQSREQVAASEVRNHVIRLLNETRQRSIQLFHNLAQTAADRQRSARLVRELRETIELSKASRETSQANRAGRLLGEMPASDPSTLEALTEVANSAQFLITLPELFPRSDQWPTTVAEMIIAERSYVRKRLRVIGELEMSMIVDARYEAFLPTGKA